jgi:GGDEF domain-containing protein
MLWYVAIIAVVNLALGYLWGAYLRPCPRCAKARAMGLSLLVPSLESRTERQEAPSNVASVAEPPQDSQPSDATTSSSLESSAPIADSASTTAPLDPASGLVTREYAELVLSQLSAADTTQLPLTVALVELAPIDVVGERPDPMIDKRLLCGVSNVVRQSLADDHMLARFSEQQLLLLVPHEDVEHVSRRAEELRQRVATTEFMVDGKSYQTTVTCALAEATPEQNGSQLFDFLQEALGEAKRYGGNRTFTHNGSSPTPVMPAELSVAPQQLAI